MIGMAELVLARIAASMREEWFGTHLGLLPLIPWKHWLPKLALFARVLSRGSSPGRRLWVPVVGDVRWAVFRIAIDA